MGWELTMFPCSVFHVAVNLSVRGRKTSNQFWINYFWDSCLCCVHSSVCLHGRGRAMFPVPVLSVTLNLQCVGGKYQVNSEIITPIILLFAVFCSSVVCVHGRAASEFTFPILSVTLNIAMCGEGSKRIDSEIITLRHSCLCCFLLLLCLPSWEGEERCLLFLYYL